MVEAEGGDDGIDESEVRKRERERERVEENEQGRLGRVSAV